MKLLLFTDRPPGDGWIDQIVQALPAAAAVCVVLAYPELRTPSELPLPTRLIDRPEERGARLAAPFALLPGLPDLRRRLADRLVRRPRLLGQATAYGRRHGVDAILAVLQGQTLTALAEPLARSLDVPLYALAREPPEAWIAGDALNPADAKAARAAFAGAIRFSRGVGAASTAMAVVLEQGFGVRTLAVPPGLDTGLARCPAPRLSAGAALTIGFAGPMRALDAFFGLTCALNACGWNLRGREVRLRLLRVALPPQGIAPERLDVGGPGGDAAVVEALSACDLIYCPSPFDTDSESDRLGFPATLALCLAAGRPVLAHGPTASAATGYVRDHEVGACATGRHASSIYNAIDGLVRNPEAYRTAALNAQRGFVADFTVQGAQANLRSLLGLTEAPTSSTALFAVEDTRVGRRTPPRPGRLWLLKRSVAGRQALGRTLRAQFSPVRTDLALPGGLGFRKFPLEGPEGEADFSSGDTPWTYVAALDLSGRPAQARYLSLDITVLGEEAYVLLVDGGYNALGERIAVPRDHWWFRIWFDLRATPGAQSLIVQAGAAPRGARIVAHRAALYGG